MPVVEEENVGLPVMVSVSLFRGEAEIPRHLYLKLVVSEQVASFSVLLAHSDVSFFSWHVLLRLQAALKPDATSIRMEREIIFVSKTPFISSQVQLKTLPVELYCFMRT